MGLLVAGTNPAALKTANRAFFTATAGQTIFTIPGGYPVGDLDVYMNGIKLVEADDYSATNGTTVVLSSGANAGDSISAISYTQFLVSNSYSKSESDNRYLALTGGSMSSYIRTPNYGITSGSDSSYASMEANNNIGTQGTSIRAYGKDVASVGGDILYTTDSRGAGGRHRFGFWNGTSFTSTMTIDSTGRTTIPNQPSFLYFSDGSSTDFTTTTSTKINVYKSLGYARGGGYDSSISRFTCQVAGVYIFRAQAWCPPTATLGAICFKVNGVTQYGEARVSKAAASANYNSLNLVIQIYMNVNEYIEIWTGPDSGTTVHTSSGTSYSGFSGHLLA